MSNKETILSGIMNMTILYQMSSENFNFNMHCKYSMTNYNSVKAYWTGGDRLGVGVEIPGKNVN